MATRDNSKNENGKVVSAEQVPVVGDVVVQTEQPAKANSGESAGVVNPELDTEKVTIGEDSYAAGERHNLKNVLFDLKDADGVHYFVKV